MKLISAPWLLFPEGSDSLQDGALAIDEDKIIAVGTKENLKNEFPKALHEDFPKGVLIPGLVNAHCHIDRIGFFERFTIETENQLSPVTWLLEGLHYLSKTPAGTVSDKIQKGLGQLLSNGTTCIGAMTHYEGTFLLFQNHPIRGVIFQEILSGPDKRAQQRFEVALALMEQYSNAKPSHLKIGFGPYAAYLLSKNLLNIIVGHSKDANLPLQMHAAESFAETEFFYDSKGSIATQLFPAIGWEELPPAFRKTPIQYLEEIGFFTTPISLIGGYQLSTSDFARLAKARATVVYCPSANRRFKLGQLSLKSLNEHNIPVALGTELVTQSEGFDLWEEMRLALKEGSNPLPTPFELLKMATLGGAKALNFEKEIGSLSPGKKADYLVVDIPDGDCSTLDGLCKGLVLQTTSSSIKRVAIGGQVVHGN